MTTHVICSRCGKPMRPVVSDGTDAPTQGFCFCPPPVGWGHYTLAPVDWRDAELAALRAELEQERSRSSESSGETTGSDERGTVDPAEIRRLHGLIAALRAQYAGSQAERDKYAAALVEIRGICTAMMDGWGQTVTVLDKIRKITFAAIKRQPGEPAHRPETFA